MLLFGLIGALFGCCSCAANYPMEIASSRKCGQVHLTVSASQDTHLELNWNTDCYNDSMRPEYVALYSQNPNDRNEEQAPLAQVAARQHPDGFYRTRVKFGHPWLPGNWEYGEGRARPDPGPHCFPYWIASLRGGELVHVACLGIQPTWMNDNRAAIGSQRLGNLFIPGTHNSAASSGVPRFLAGYVLCQDRSVFTQLVHGIRYLDLRIGYYEEQGFYVNHDLVRISRLESIFEEIRRFAELAPKEIVIVDFHRFPFPQKFTPTMHSLLAELIYDHLGDLALPPGNLQAGKGPSLNDIWATNKNLVICYNDKTVVRTNHWLWQPLQQLWADTKKVSELKRFIGSAISDHRPTINPMYAIMAELTPQPLDIILRTNSLRKLANDVNRHLTKWFRDDFAPNTNIVATDYFLGNDLINIAIQTNINR